ncbi:MAG: transketolase, partial [Mesorhizobium sp.]
PADAVETAECWQIALESEKTPSTLALTRQNLPTVRTEHSAKNLSSQGAYELAAANGEAVVTIFATGSEVEIAPCFELFDQQSDDYRKKTIGNAKVKVAIEAGIRQGWDHLIGTDGIFVGMHGFGASGSIEQLYPHFGITAEAAAKAVETRLHG